MSEYKSIKGKTVQSLGTDPSETSTEGQVWYNSTAGAFKSVVTTAGWSSGAPLSTGRSVADAFGTLSAGVYVGGQPAPSYYNLVEEYNGTGWSSGTNYPQNKTAGGAAGTLTAGLVAGGNTPPFTSTANEYDGSAWTGTGSLPTAADNIGSCGADTQSNVIMALGRTPSTGNGGNNTTATYNGSTFSAGPNINTARLFGPGGGAGTGTAGLIFGGFIDPSPNNMTNTEEYNGTSWSTANPLNNPSGLNCGWGTQTNAVAQTTPDTYRTMESYDGTSWTVIDSLTQTGNAYANAAGSNGNSGFISSMGPTLGSTEEYNTSINVITGAAWASGGNMGSALRGRSGGGAQTAAIAAGGEVPRTSNTELYDGTSWTEVNNLNTARNQTGGAGTQTSFLVFGGEAPGPTGVTESWDGSSWSEVNDLGTARRNVGGFGTQTAAVAAGGFGPGTGDYTAVVEEWNGSSWTANPNSLPTATAQMDAVGTATAGLVFGGIIPPSAAKVSTTFEFDGTSFSSSGNLNTATAESHMTAGSQTAGLLAGGYAPTASTKTETFDGSVWSTSANMATPRGGGSGLGSNSVSTAGLAAGGNNPGGDLNATEEFTGETSAINIKTLTTS